MEAGDFPFIWRCSSSFLSYVLSTSFHWTSLNCSPLISPKSLQHRHINFGWLVCSGESKLTRAIHKIIYSLIFFNKVSKLFPRYTFKRSTFFKAVLQGTFYLSVGVLWWWGKRGGRIKKEKGWLMKNKTM